MKAVLIGGRELAATLKRINEQADREITNAVKAAGLAIRGHAMKSIQRGAKTGEVYDKTTPRRTHRASAPGQSPATDTGRLVNSLRSDVSGKTATVSANTTYAAALEFGTSKMKPRPYLIPAVEMERPHFERRMREAIAKASK
jgi:HK97 gp10 family phage protein